MSRKAAEPERITEAEPAAVKPKRECWTAGLKRLITPEQGGDPNERKHIQVISPTFRRAALKADNWCNKNGEWQVESLAYNADTVI